MKPYYQDGAVTIYHGDCVQVLPYLPSFDLLLTDPKYGIGADAAAAKNKGNWGWKDYGATNWDASRTPAWLLQMAMTHATDAIIWGGNYFSDALPPRMGWLVWNKMQREFSLSDGELAWSSFEKALRIADISRAAALQDFKEHPTQKSLELMRWCLLYADRARGSPALTILDPFAGTGTTGRACKDLGRQCTLIEQDESYCEIAARKMGQEVLAL